MNQHPMAGKPMRIKQGPLTNQYVIIVDWLVRQFQGKAIEKIHKGHPHLTKPVLDREFKLDDKFVFVRLYPSMDFGCVHDSELLEAEPAELNVGNVVSLAAKRQEKVNDTGATSQSNHQPSDTGEPESDGRSVSSADGTGENEGEAEGQGQTDSPTGGAVGGPQLGEASSNQREAKKGTGATGKNRGKGKK